MKKDAFYFPHFSNARYDNKIRRLRKDLGIEGYAIYFMLLETLREQSDFSYPVEDADLLADEFGTTLENVMAVINTEGLFQINEEGLFFSPKLIEYLSPYLKEKERNRMNGIKGNLIRHGHATKEDLKDKTPREIQLLNDTIANSSGGDSGGGQGAIASKVKKSKEKESKEKESKVNESVLEARAHSDENINHSNLSVKAPVKAKVAETIADIPDRNLWDEYLQANLRYSAAFTSHLWDHLASVGWKAGNNHILDWKAYARKQTAWNSEYNQKLEKIDATKSLKPNGKSRYNGFGTTGENRTEQFIRRGQELFGDDAVSNEQKIKSRYRDIGS